MARHPWRSWIVEKEGLIGAAMLYGGRGGKINKLIRIGRAILVFALLASATQAQTRVPATTIHLRFGVGPYQSATVLAKHWTPIISYLENATGYTLELTTATDVPMFTQKMQQGQYDLAYTNPYVYTLFHKSAGYHAFAKERNAPLTGIILVRAHSPYRNLQDLNGLTVAFPGAAAPAATLLPLAHFKQLKMTVTPSYVISLKSVYLAVSKGLFPAGGGELKNFMALDPVLRHDLRILWIGPSLPAFAFSAHPRVPKVVIARIQRALVDMNNDPEGVRLLKKINGNGFISAVDSDYDTVRARKLEIFDASGGEDGGGPKP